MNSLFTKQFYSARNWYVPDRSIHDTLVSEVCENYTGDPFTYERSLVDVISLLAEVEADWEMAAVAALRGMKTGKKIQLEQIRKKFDASSCQLYEGTLQLDSISLTVERGDVQKASAARPIDLSRILIAMVDDARVIVIHLAELLVHMREAKELPEPARQSLAKQILSIYTPLANKLGIWRMKWELEDLSFKYLNRLEFDRIALQLDERRIEREGYIQKFVGQLNSLMVKSKIQATVNGRAKHIYGIWRKLNQKGVKFDHIFDVRAVRILVDDIASCYAALGAVHASWTSVAGEFDDYIAMPKSNGYRSLHTAVFGPDSKVVEVQIRTVEMHNDCEFGVSAHWKYKESAKSNSYQDEKVNLLRQLLDWKAEVAGTFDRNLSSTADSVNEEIYVFTPAGNVVELPVHSTPIDFAYAIHTEVGHRCRGAQVNNKIVPLTHELKTGDWVQIRTVKSGGPSRDWLNSHQKFTVSARARNRIRRWFKLEEYGRYQALGKTLLEKELNRHGLSKTNLEKLAVDNDFRRSQDLFTAIGLKELKPTHAVACLIEKDSDKTQDQEFHINLPRPTDTSTASLSILGVDNLLTNHASCCGPLPGDDVVGYVTVSRGITIHRRNCGNIKRMVENHPDRMVSVDWQYDNDLKHAVDIELVAEGHHALLQDITAAVAELGFHLVAVNTTRIKTSELGKIYLTVEVGSAGELKKTLGRLLRIERVVKARRIND